MGSPHRNLRSNSRRVMLRYFGWMGRTDACTWKRTMKVSFV